MQSRFKGTEDNRLVGSGVRRGISRSINLNLYDVRAVRRTGVVSIRDQTHVAPRSVGEVVFFKTGGGACTVSSGPQFRPCGAVVRNFEFEARGSGASQIPRDVHVRDGFQATQIPPDPRAIVAEAGFSCGGRERTGPSRAAFPIGCVRRPIAAAIAESGGCGHRELCPAGCRDSLCVGNFRSIRAD